MVKKVSLRKIAKESGCALCTVSRALNSGTPVAETTRKKILETAHRLGYRPTSRKLRIALVVNDTFFHTVYDKNLSAILLQEIHKKGYSAVVLTVKDLDFLSLSWTDGIISYCYDPEEERKIAKKYNIPIVCINNSGCLYENIYAVNSDDENAVRSALELFVSKGHTKIAFLEPEPATISGKLRKKYYENLMRKEFHLKPRFFITPGSQVWQGVQRVVNEGITALIIPFELQNNNGFYFCRFSGISIPQELSIITWESPGISEFFQPPLTTLGQDFGQLAEQSLALLEKLCSSSKKQLGNCQVPYILHLRESVGKCNDKTTASE